MISILILADDLTGALDTGVQFIKNGVKVLVTSDVNYNFLSLDPEVKVLSINTNTRHLSPEEAYARIYNITKEATKAGVKYIYKKTDSVMRGNIGSELSAVLAASNEKYLAFVPSYPKMNRIVKNGILYVNGLPIGNTTFSKDPFNKIKGSRVVDIVKHNYEIPVHHLGASDEIADCNLDSTKKHIVIFDSETDDHIRNIGNKLINKYDLKLLAGCAGFASKLAEIIGLEGNHLNSYKRSKPLLVACGSLNITSIKQMEYAVKQGFQRHQLSNVVNISNDFLKSKSGEDFIQALVDNFDYEANIIIDTLGDFNNKKDQPNSIDEDTRTRIANNFGHIIKCIITKSKFETILVTGGDILKGFMDSLNCNEIFPVAEIIDGTVMFKVEYMGKELQVIAKSGGFGEEDTYVKIANMMCRGDGSPVM